MRMFQTWLWSCPRVRPFVSDALLIDSALAPLGGAFRRRAHRFTSPLRSGPASSGRIQSGRHRLSPTPMIRETRAGPAIGRLATARGSARPAPALYWLAGPIVNFVAGNKPWSGPRSYCWRSRASRRRAIPRRPSRSIARSGRSCPTIAIPATGPTRPSARPACGSTSSHRPGPIATAAVRSSRAIWAASELYRRITADDPDERMPPPKSGKVLSPAQTETIRRWIDQGAKWQKHWAFIPPQRPPIPRVERMGWVRNPIDAFVLARLEREGLSPAPEADRGDPDPPRHARPDRPAAHARRGRRLSSATPHRTPTSGSSIGC